MAKILLTITALHILAFIVVAMYCAMVVAGRSDENENNGDNSEGDDDVFWNKKYAQDVRQANILMTLILNQRLAHISGVGGVTNVAFISHSKRALKMAFLTVLKISEALPLKN